MAAMSDIDYARLRDCSEADVVAAHAQLLDDDFSFALGWDDQTPWAEYVESVERIERGEDVGYGLVPATFRVAVIDGRIVGRVSVRHQLSLQLLNEFGHVGIAVVPEFRRQGIGVDLVETGVSIAQEHGANPVLAVCAATNLGSANTLLSAGGIEELGEHISPQSPVRRFWFGLA